MSSITPPKPGQLITVTFVKSILDKLDSLEGRIAALEKPSVTDSSIALNINFVTPPGALIDPTTKTLRIAAGVTVTVGISAVFLQPGTYNITLVQSSPLTNGTPSLTFDTPANFTIQPGEIPPGGQTARTPKFFFTPPAATAPTAGTLEFHIKRDGAPNDQLIIFKLVTA